MTLVEQFDAAIKAVSKLSDLMHIADLKREADATDRRECGNCTKWMKKPNCPRERGLGSGMGGPSMSAPACDQFELTPWVAELKSKRMAEVERRLAEHQS